MSSAAGIPVSVDRMLRVGSDFRRGIVATDDPVLLVLCQTVADPSRAPDRMHTLKIVGFQPYELPDGPARWDEIQDQVSQANLEHLRRYAPNLTDDTILARVVESPLGLERLNAHNWHGSCHGGEQGVSQSGALRPRRDGRPTARRSRACTRPARPPTRAGRSRQAPDEMRQSSC